ncbi:hypothetical protein [Qipengyuania atrilutea]|uniref:Secreted protein n=1 Tax=Qipengyuania atrilutea TaxID=2744473 RepID=A0A850GXM6_9SPHN|nr:hypothetical protein [Actirhodobacter atriluteus]NVD44344.1 hypothetical protein [Actirhodobacter atriluteus]
MKTAIIALLAASLAGTAGTAQIQRADDRAATEPTEWNGDRAEALPPPRMWDCQDIAPEYRDWLGGDNAAGDWKYAGRAYIDRQEGRRYDWAEWLDWYEGVCGEALSAATDGPDVLGTAASISALVGFVAMSADAGEGRAVPPTRNDSPG